MFPVGARSLFKRSAKVVRGRSLQTDTIFTFSGLHCANESVYADFTATRLDPGFPTSDVELGLNILSRAAIGGFCEPFLGSPASTAFKE
jgi:hypothetical protein